MDQNLVYYPFIRKSREWTKKFVPYLFQIALFNAFTIYKAKNPQGNCKCQFSFILSVINSWTSQRFAGTCRKEDWVDPQPDPQPDPECPPRTPRHDPRRRLNGDIAAHVLVKFPSTVTRDHPVRRCRVCVKNNRRRETRFYCQGCSIPLCRLHCFTIYHTKIKYA